MRRRTHIMMTRNLLPYVSVDDIDKVSSRLDNPSNVDMIATNFFGGGSQKQNTDIFGLTRRGGHRSWNHDVASAMLIGYMSNQKFGVDIAIAHLLEDHLSNMLIDAVGIDQKEVLESLINLSLSNKNKKRRRRASAWFS